MPSSTTVKMSLINEVHESKDRHKTRIAGLKRRLQAREVLSKSSLHRLTITSDVKIPKAGRMVKREKMDPKSLSFASTDRAASEVGVANITTIESDPSASIAIDLGNE